jgi:predicted nucleotide-binding protein (sugar kinase/HSP70/actin superfamily)
MRIGIPRALLYHYYFSFWQSLFQELGAEVVVSDISTTRLVQGGINITVPEICLPIKIFNGHVVNLLSKNIDYIFIPRCVSIGKNEWCCPKFLGLPELVRYTVKGAEEKLLVIDITEGREDICSFKDYQKLLDIFSITRKELRDALNKAGNVWLDFRKQTKEKLNDLSKETTDITLGILGYVYNIYDPFISLDVINKLKEMDTSVITFDMLDEQAVNYKGGAKSLYWTFTNKLYGAALNLMKHNQVDGIIHVTAFGCGPDSILGKYLEVETDAHHIPFMTLRVDEHTGESHLQTRIEAFIDLLRRKKGKEARGELA